ncbi:MAG TPA: cupin domain-containing protein [Candidatus Dormibacteraeota bacterium]|nr:cupin domain-containing protein [Candidatus Dormibacteraeota bacterium]
MVEPGTPLSHQPVRRVEKPWGYEIWFAVTDRYAGKIIHIDAGHELSLQYHERKDESIYVLSGKMELELDNARGELQTVPLGPGQCQRIEAGQRHRMRALEETEVCEVSTPDLEDVVRLHDRYGRVETPSD